MGESERGGAERESERGGCRERGGRESERARDLYFNFIESYRLGSDDPI